MQTTWMKMATEGAFVIWWSSPGAALYAMLCREGGVVEALPPHRSQASDRMAEAAVRLGPVYHIWARRLSPGQGPSGEPEMAGGVAKVTGKGGLRRGRSVRGEHRCDDGERPPLPTSFPKVVKGASGEVLRQAVVQTLRRW